MKGPYAMAAAGALTAVVLAGVVGIGARGGSFGLGGEDEEAEHRPIAVETITTGAAAGPATPVLERRQQAGDQRRDSHRGRERDHDDDDDD